MEDVNCKAIEAYFEQNYLVLEGSSARHYVRASWLLNDVDLACLVGLLLAEQDRRAAADDTHFQTGIVAELPY